MSALQQLRDLRDTIGKAVSEYQDKRLISRLVDGVDDEHRPMYEVVLKNQLMWNRQSGIHPSHQYPLLQTAKAVMDHLSRLQAIVGVQPLVALTGLIFIMECSTDDSTQTDQFVSRTLSVISRPVVAQTSTLNIHWPLDVFIPRSDIHGDTYQDAITAAVSQEVAYDIISNVLRKIAQVAEYKDACDADAVAVLAKIDALANQVGRETRRGRANVITTTPQGAKLLFQLPGPARFIPAAVSKMGWADPLYLAGHVVIGDGVNQYTVYVTRTQLPGVYIDIPFLVSFKGPTPIDAGLVYCPYVPIMPQRPVIDPLTFQPTHACKTRHALGENSIAGKYYALLTVGYGTNPTPEEQ